MSPSKRLKYAHIIKPGGVVVMEPQLVQTLIAICSHMQSKPLGPTFVVMRGTSSWWDHKKSHIVKLRTKSIHSKFEKVYSKNS